MPWVGAPGGEIDPSGHLLSRHDNRSPPDTSTLNLILLAATNRVCRCGSTRRPAAPGHPRRTGTARV